MLKINKKFINLSMNKKSLEFEKKKREKIHCNNSLNSTINFIKLKNVDW